MIYRQYLNLVVLIFDDKNIRLYYMFNNNRNANITQELAQTRSVNLPRCYAPGLSIDGLILPDNIYSIISVAGRGNPLGNTWDNPLSNPLNNSWVNITVMTLYVRDYDCFNTFTICDPTNKTKITIGANMNGPNIIKRLDWNETQLNAECLFNPRSSDSIEINWLYNKFVIVSTTPFFK